MKLVFFTTRSGHSPVIKFLNGLSLDDKVRCLEHFSHLEKYGFQLSAKYIKKIKGEKRLWELRVSASKQYRFLFTTQSHQYIILLGFVKKTQKTPMNAIKLALKRSKNL